MFDSIANVLAIALPVLVAVVALAAFIRILTRASADSRGRRINDVQMNPPVLTHHSEQDDVDYMGVDTYDNSITLSQEEYPYRVLDEEPQPSTPQGTGPSVFADLLPPAPHPERSDAAITAARPSAAVLFAFIKISSLL